MKNLISLKLFAKKINQNKITYKKCPDFIDLKSGHL